MSSQQNGWFTKNISTLISMFSILFGLTVGALGLWGGQLTSPANTRISLVEAEQERMKIEVTTLRARQGEIERLTSQFPKKEDIERIEAELRSINTYLRDEKNR
jgi:hypothetical protein